MSSKKTSRRSAGKKKKKSRRVKLPTAVAPHAVPAGASPDHAALFFNRELSWLDFCWRVFAQVLDNREPLLERVRFLNYTAGHLDEFFSKRVGGLKRQEMAGVRSLSPDGRTPRQQLNLIRDAVLPLYDAMTTVWERDLKPLLKHEADIHIVDYADLKARQQKKLDTYFQEHVYPILTPQAVDPGHPFPFISNLSLSLAVMLRHPVRGTLHFARIKVPGGRSRWVSLSKRRYVIPLEQVIIHNLSELFRGMEVVSAHAFRITRNADLSRDEEEADDLIEMISGELRERRFATVVRLEVERTMPVVVRELLKRELELGDDDLYEAESLIDFTACTDLANQDVLAHRYAPWLPLIPAALYSDSKEDEPDVFEVMRKGDILMHHPYDSFQGSVQRFVEAAAADPDVMAIKQTLYRTSEESPVMVALIQAAEAGKKVNVLIEVMARYDEQQNIAWGQRLEKSGVQVSYGIAGLKTHAKVTLVIRKEEGGQRTYCHIGTGNYNPTTARIYTDISLLTCHPDVVKDVANLFQYLTGNALTEDYRTLIVAPHAMRKAFVDLIQQEVNHQRQHGNGHIIAMMNGLDDSAIIQELYKASQAGVQIDLIVRGHCRLRPGLKGFSETIRVMSIIGRFLEDSRLFYFHNNDDPKVLVGSADWMRRNLDDRVETVVPISNAALKKRLIKLLHKTLADKRLAWDLHASGRYVQRQSAKKAEAQGLHDLLMREAQRTRAKVLRSRKKKRNS